MDDLEKIKSLVAHENYDEAFLLCQKLLEERPERMIEILRVRAYAFAQLGDYAEALIDYEAIFDSGYGTIRDYYQGGFHALYAGEFTKANDWLRKVLLFGAKDNENWFESATYFYLAYVQMELGNYKAAIQNLDEADRVEEGVSMPLPNVGLCPTGELRKEIRRRAKHGPGRR